MLLHPSRIDMEKSPPQTFRILVIEDDPGLGQMLLHYLQTLNFDARHASDGLTGIEMLKEFDPHLITLDLMMPGMDGREVLAEIRQTSTIPVIVTTALDETHGGIGSFREGADDYVVKPFDPAVLMARIVAHLRRTYSYPEQE